MKTRIEELEEKIKLLKKDISDKIDNLTDESKEEDLEEIDQKTKEKEAVEGDLEKAQKIIALKSFNKEIKAKEAIKMASPSIVKEVHSGNDPETAPIRSLIYKTLIGIPGVSREDITRKMVKSWGTREVDFLEKDFMGVADQTLQAPNYRGDLLIPLLNKNVVTEGIFKNITLENNNLIVPRIISPSSGGFNLEKGLIQETSFGSDTKVLQGAFYGSIITSTLQALQYSIPGLESVIQDELTSRHKLTVEAVGINSDGSIPGVPTGLKGFTKKTQNISYADFSAYYGKYDQDSSFAVIQMFSSLVTKAKRTITKNGDYKKPYMIISEDLMGDLESRMTMTGNYVLQNLLNGKQFGIEVRSSGNISTNETSLINGSTNTEANVSPCYIVTQDSVWRGNGDFYQFDTFNSGTTGSANLVTQAGKAWRLLDSIQFGLTNDVSVHRIEIAGLVDPLDNGATAYIQPESGEIAAVSGLGKPKSK